MGEHRRSERRTSWSNLRWRRWWRTAGQNGVLHGLPLATQLHDLVQRQDVLLLPVTRRQHHRLRKCACAINYWLRCKLTRMYLYVGHYGKEKKIVLSAPQRTAEKHCPLSGPPPGPPGSPSGLPPPGPSPGQPPGLPLGPPPPHLRSVTTK